MHRENASQLLPAFYVVLMSDITIVSHIQMGTQKPIVHRPPRTPVTQARLCANLSQVFVLKKKKVFHARLIIFPPTLMNHLEIYEAREASSNLLAV